MSWASRLLAAHPAKLAERARQSLYAIPAVCLVAGVVLADVTTRLDRSNAGAWLPDNYETTSENARVVLGAIATGTITVVTLVLTLTLVAIQLTAGQLSPRTIVNFLGDRFQQATVGVVLATAAFSLVALRAIRVDTEGLQPPDLTVLTAVISTIVSLMMLVVSVDRTANRLSVSTLVRDVADETCRLIDQRYGADERQLPAERPGRLMAEPARDHDERQASEARQSVEATHSGWIQYINEDTLLAALPDRAGVALQHPVGTFVVAGMELVTIDTSEEVDQSQLDEIHGAVAVGEQRTMQQDVSYGLTRLTDIGLRALSPGINDPNTAREVIVRMAQVMLAIQSHDLDPADIEIDGHRVVRRGAPTHDSFARDAFDQLRRAAQDDTATLRTLRESIDAVRRETERRSLPGSGTELDRQFSLVTQRLAAISDPGAEDLDDDGRGSGQLP